MGVSHPEALRESLAASRTQRLPFPVAWEIATTDHPLEDFMEGYFNEGRDSEGNDFARWLEQIWAKAYNRLSPAKKATRLEPRNTYAEGVSEAYNGSQTPLNGNQSCHHPARGQAGVSKSDQLDGVGLSRNRGLTTTGGMTKRCKSGDRCDRVGGHGLTGRFCEHHAGELARIRRVHGLDEAWDWDEFSSKTYQAAFG